MHKINIPDDLYMHIMEQAKRERRSVTGHLLCILDAHFGTTPDVAIEEPAKIVPTEPVRRNKYEGLTGDALMDAMDADTREDYRVRE